MPGESFLMTFLALGIVRRVGLLVCTAAGRDVATASRIADDIGIPAAALVAGAAAVLLGDPVGLAFCVVHLGLEAREAGPI